MTGKLPIPMICNEPNFWGKAMLGRILSTLFLMLALLGVVTGCDNRPKVIMPTQKAPPAPRPRVTGGGAAPGKLGPETETREKLPAPKELPPDSTPPEDKE